MWCRHFSTDVWERKSLSLIKKQKEGIGNIVVLPHFYFLSSLKDGIMKSTEAWTSRKHHGCLRKSFHFPPFLLNQEDGPAPSLFMPLFTVRNRRKEKWDDIEKLLKRWFIIIFFILCPLTLPHYHSLCWRRDRNGALWAKEWPIHPFHNIPLHKRYCYIFLSFVEMFAASLLYLLTFRREVRHVLLSFTWHLLFLSTRVDLWNRIPMVKENPENIRKISNFDFQAWKIDFKAEYIYFF